MKSVTRQNISDEYRRTGTFRALLDVQCNVFESDQECQVFDLYRFMTGSRHGLFFGLDFWTGRVLQVSHTDTAIRHAVLALGALQREPELAHQLALGNPDGFAFQSYQKAITHTSRLLSKSGKENFEKGLMACILFICYESLQGHYTKAHMHLQNGLRIIDEVSREPPRADGTYRQEVPDDILHVFARLDLQALSLLESSSPYPLMKAFGRMKQPKPIPLEFSSLAEAQYFLFEHSRSVCLLSEVLETTELIYVQGGLPSREQCDEELARWLTRLDLFHEKSKLDGSWTVEMQDAYTLLRVYHGITLAVSDSFSLDSELLYDRQYLRFQTMLDLLESITPAPSTVQPSPPPEHKVLFSFELGVVLPLYIIGTKCRDPILRRRAIAQLKSANRREGFWDSRAATVIAEAIMNMEEEGLGDVQTADQIGNERRVRAALSSNTAERCEVRIHCKMNRGPDGRYKSRTLIIHCESGTVLTDQLNQFQT